MSYKNKLASTVELARLRLLSFDLGGKFQSKKNKLRGVIALWQLKFNLKFKARKNRLKHTAGDIRWKLNDDYGISWSVVIAVWFIFFGVVLAQMNLMPLSGGVTAHRYWLSAAFQGIATLFALVISASLIVVQLASQTYTHRIVHTLFRKKSFWIGTVFGIFLLAYLLYIQTTISDNREIPTTLLWIAFLLALVYFSSLPYTINLAFTSMSPRHIIFPVLDRIDRQFIDRLNYRHFSEEFLSPSPDDNPILDVESVVSAFLRQQEFALAEATINSFADTLIEKGTERDYAALVSQCSSTIQNIARQLSAIRNRELFRELVARLANLHRHLFNLEYASTFGYQHHSFPQLVMKIGADSIRDGFPDGAEQCFIALGWMAADDLKKFKPDSENYWRHYMANFGADGLAKPTPAHEAIRRQQENFEHLYLYEASRMPDEATSSVEAIIEFGKRYFENLCYALRAELKEDRAKTRHEIIQWCAYHLKSLSRQALRIGALETALEFDSVLTHASWVLNDNEIGIANDMTETACDAVLRAVEEGVACHALYGPIMKVTCDGALRNEQPEGSAMATISINTLCRLAELMPTKYSGHGLNGDFKQVYDELGRRLLQIWRNRKRVPISKDSCDRIVAVLTAYWPELKIDEWPKQTEGPPDAVPA